MRHLELDGPGEAVSYVVQSTEDLNSGQWADTDIASTYSPDKHALPTSTPYRRMEFEVDPGIARKFQRVKVSTP